MDLDLAKFRGGALQLGGLLLSVQLAADGRGGPDGASHVARLPDEAPQHLGLGG